MSKLDYIPQADTKFLEWATVFVRVLGRSLAAFGFPEENYAQLVLLLDDFTQKLELATSPGTRTVPTVQGKNTARQALKKAIRQAVKEYLSYNHLLAKTDRTVLGLPVRDEKLSRVPAIASRPELEVDFSEIQIHTLTVRNSELSVSASLPTPSGSRCGARWARPPPSPKLTGNWWYRRHIRPAC